MITKPELPPRKGFVEVEVDGKRMYRAIAPTPTAEPQKDPEPTTEQVLAVLLGEVSA